MRGKSRSRPTQPPRHADIMRLMKKIHLSDDDPAVIAERRLNATLNDVNAAGFMVDTQQRAPHGLMIYGPKSLQGADWCAVVTWAKRNTYHAYKMITLLGVWAVMQDDGVSLIVGTRPLLYQAPIYAPDSYFHQIKRDFRLYYGKDARPPEGATQLYRIAYTEENRIRIRQEIDATLTEWRAAQVR